MRHMACQSNRFRSGRLAECRVRSHCWAKATDQALDKAVSEACKMFGVPEIHDQWIFRAERLSHTRRRLCMPLVSKMVSPAARPCGSQGWTLNFSMRDQVQVMSLQGKRLRAFQDRWCTPDGRLLENTCLV